MKRTMNVASRPGGVDPAAERRTCGDDATSPVSSPSSEAPDDYGATLADISQRVLTQGHWATRLVNQWPKDLEGSLPTMAQIAPAPKTQTDDLPPN